jgi:restriction system protein
MAIPVYSEIMMPLLRHISDGKAYRFSEVVEALSDKLKLSEDDRRAKNASGNQRTFDNRVGWSRTYLKKAGLIEYVGKGEFCITQRGRDVLAENPSCLNSAYLKRFPEFQEFVSNKTDASKTEEIATESDTIDPREALELNYQKITQALAEQLLETVKQAPPRFFEQLVVDLLVAMGYGGSRQDTLASVTPYSKDGGIDGIIREDRLGLEAIYIQAKRWDAAVGRPVVQAFAGSMEGKGKKGVLITTSSFSKEAHEYVEHITEKKIILIDGRQMVEYMIDYNVGVSEKDRYLIKDLDLDYFALV